MARFLDQPAVLVISSGERSLLNIFDADDDQIHNFSMLGLD